VLLTIHRQGGRGMSIAVVKDTTIDRDKWLEQQIQKLTKELLKQPKNNRGPFVISDEMLVARRVRSHGENKIKLIK
jgi:hypothetical protein